jgi:hypothetical protein
MNAYPWLVWLHVLGAFVFAFGHGASAVAAFKVRGERDRARITALLDVSQLSTGAMYVGLLVLLAGGIAAGVVGQWFWQLWLVAAIVILIVIMFAMYAIASPYYGRLRGALGQKGYGRNDAAPRPLSDAELVALLDSRRPEALAAVGSIGLAIILWLMVFKPA